MKIAVCIPMHRAPRAGFTLSLARMLCNTFQWNINIDGRPTKPVIEIFVYSTASVAYTRNVLADRALASGADQILWLDDDHTFPPDTLIRLLAREKPVVGINYVRRNEGGGPVAKRDGVPVTTTEEKAKAGQLEEVSSTGLGVMLVAARALRAVQRPRFDGPWEDVHFCERLRAAGFAVHVDHQLSWASHHIGEQLFGFDTKRGGDDGADSDPAPPGDQQGRHDLPGRGPVGGR